MHKDYKLRRAQIKEIQMRELREEKRVCPRALEKFREKLFQQRYAEMMRDGGSTNDDR